MSIADIYANPQNDVYNVKTHASGPKGSLPLTGDMLRELPCGDIFGMTLDAGMGWKPEDILGPNVLIISTLGGKRNDDGTPDALQMPPNKNFLKLFLKRPRQIPKNMLYYA